MKNIFLISAAAAFLSTSGAVSSAEIGAIAVRYVYDSYKATLRKGASLSLRQLGAKKPSVSSESIKV